MGIRWKICRQNTSKMSDVEGEGASRKTSYKIPRKRVHDILLEDADALGVKRMKLRLKFQRLDDKNLPERKILKKVIQDCQMAKELLQDEARDNHANEETEKAKVALAASDLLKETQQYVHLFFTKGPEVAARYIEEGEDDELEFSSTQLSRIANAEREVEKNKGKKTYTTEKPKMNRDKAPCKGCGAIGHWKYDRNPDGSYICPSMRTTPGAATVPTAEKTKE